MADNTANEPIDLIVRAQRGSPDATGALYSLYHQSIYRYIYYRTGDTKTAEDLTSDVFLKMVQYIPSYRIENTPLKAWLFQIARNLLIDYYRRNSTHRVVEINESLDSGDFSIDRTIDFHLTTNEMIRALSHLDTLQREVLVLRFIEGMPVAEVARVLHKSEDATKAIQRRALIALRSLINPQEIERD